MTRPEQVALAAAGLGAAGAVAGRLLAPDAFAPAWLAAAVFCSGWPLGAMTLLCAHALTGGRWGEAVRPALRIGVMTLPLSLLLLLPLIGVAPALYPWLRAAELPNGWYLNPSFVMLRGLVCVVVWLLIAASCLWLRRLDRVAAPCLLLLAVTVTAAAVDATMSLDPRFTSSLYGMLAAAGMAVLALSVAILLGGAPIAGGDLGKLLLALCVLWTYLDFMQLLIVWQSDLATQVPWYRQRTGSVWGWVMGAVALTHSVVPIGLLLWPPLQRRPAVLAAAAACLLAGEMLRAWWTVLPGSAPLAVACMLAACGVMAALSLRLRRGAAHA